MQPHDADARDRKRPKQDSALATIARILRLWKTLGDADKQYVRDRLDRE